MNIPVGNFSNISLKRLAAIIGPLILIVSLTLGPGMAKADENWQTKPIPYDVENGVICVLDGCMMNLSNCDDAAAQQLREIIREKMFKEGWDKEKTYAYLVSVYGDQVLAAPPRHGFNWVVWLGPFTATMGGGVLIYLGVDKWVSTRNAEEETEVVPPLTAVQAKMLEKEIKKYL